MRAEPGNQDLSHLPSQEHGSYNSRHQATPREQGQAEDELGLVPVAGPISAEPMAGRGMVVGSYRLALLQGITGEGWQPSGSWAMGRVRGALEDE